jgi:hypothetical protein
MQKKKDLESVPSPTQSVITLHAEIDNRMLLQITSLKLLSVQAPVLQVCGVLWLLHNHGIQMRSPLTAHRVAVAIKLPYFHACIY